MRVLVTFAVEAEFAPWRKLRGFEKMTKGKAQFFRARIGASEVNVLLTGVGGKNAWLQATKVICDGEVDFCISRSEEHTSELQSRENLVCRVLLEKKKESRGII